MKQSDFISSNPLKIIWQSLAVLLVVVGCSKTDDKTTDFPATFSNIYSKILSVTCVNCHTTGGGSSGVNDLDFSNANNGYSDLFSLVKSPSSPSTCTSVRRVVKNTPSQSYLAGVLFSDYNIDNFAGSSGCKPNTKHLGYWSPSTAEKNAIIDWIAAGASN